MNRRKLHKVAVYMIIFYLAIASGGVCYNMAVDYCRKNYPEVVNDMESKQITDGEKSPHICQYFYTPRVRDY